MSFHTRVLWTLAALAVPLVHILLLIVAACAAEAAAYLSAGAVPVGATGLQIAWQILVIAVMALWRSRLPSLHRYPHGTCSLPIYVFPLMAIGMYLVIAIAMTLIFIVFPDLGVSYASHIADSVGDIPGALYLLSAVVLAPLSEELAYRGVMLPCLLQASNPRRIFTSPRFTARTWLSIAAQSFAFALMHVNPVQIGYAFVLGLVFGCIYLKTGRLRYTVAVHATFNLIGFLLSLL